MGVNATSFDHAEECFRRVAGTAGYGDFKGTWYIARTSERRYTAFRNVAGAFLAGERTGSGFRVITIEG